MTSFEYSPIRRPTVDARAIQKLIRQDIEAGGFPDLDSIANPDSPYMVLRQRRKLIAAPQNYTAAYSHNDLQAFMKVGNWNIDDQIPFSNPSEVEALNALAGTGIIASPQDRLGIFGLVVANELPEGDQVEITEHLLDIATDRALHMGKTAVHIIFHENDIVTTVALGTGFEFTGRIGVASGAPGLQQRLYVKPLDT